MAGIQTSNITTAAADDLTIAPAAGKKTKITSGVTANAGETPISVKPDGTVEKLDTSALTELTDPDAGDYVVIQAGTVRADTTAGTTVAKQLYKIDSDNLGGGKPIDPLPGQITATPGFAGGSGTAGDPFIITPETVYTPGGNAISQQLITISGQKKFSPVPFFDLTTGAGNRFAQPGGTTDAAGTYSFNLYYNDAPATPLGSGQIYNGSIKCGTSSVYFRWDVTQIANLTTFGPTSAPTASPTSVDYYDDGKYGTVSATWADGSRTLNANGLVFSVNGGALNASNKSVANGNTVEIGLVDATVAGAAEGDTITGALQSTDGSYYSSFEMVKDTTPSPITVAALVDQPLSSVVTTGNNPIRGINAPTTIAAPVGGTNPLTNVEVSVNGGGFTSSYPVTFNPGDSLQARGTTGGTAGTTYTTTFNVGGTSAVFSATTGVAADLVQPQITSPPNLNGVNQAVNVTTTSTTIATVDGTAVTHGASDWQAYKATAAAAPPTLQSDIITVAPGYDGNSTQTYTLASNTGLGSFIAGNEVQMTPNSNLETSTITNVDVKSVSEVVLTLTNDQDLKYFEPGDVLQMSRPSDGAELLFVEYDEFGQWLPGDPPCAAFDNIGAGPYPPYGAAAAHVDDWAGWNNIKYEDGSPINDIVSVTIQGASSKSGGDWVRINNHGLGDGTQVPVTGSSRFCVLNAPTCFTTVSATTLTNLHIFNNNSSNEGTNIYGVRVNKADGKQYLLVKRECASEGLVEVISTEVANKKMVVNGGAWTGSDGTSSGNSADRETSVSITKTGKGKVASVNTGSNQITLSDVSPVFVATDNSKGSSHRIEDPTIPGVPEPPSDPIDPTMHTLHEESLNDTTNKTSWKPGTNYPADSTIFARVKHYDDNTPATESEWSEWSGFKTS